MSNLPIESCLTCLRRCAALYVPVTEQSAPVHVSDLGLLCRLLQVSAHVHDVLSMVDLVDIQRNLVGVPGVSGLSTEQRKRLTIAVELVANPSVLFLDEPTSGGSHGRFTVAVCAAGQSSSGCSIISQLSPCLGDVCTFKGNYLCPDLCSHFFAIRPCAHCMNF